MIAIYVVDRIHNNKIININIFMIKLDFEKNKT